jgi:sec-independent protein translocase protein TatA
VTLLVPTTAIFGGLGFAELLMVAFVSILVFGGKLPDVMRNLGQAYARIRKQLTTMSEPIRSEIQRATTLTDDAPPPMLPTSVPSVPYKVGAEVAAEVGVEDTAAPPAPLTPPPEAAPSPWPLVGTPPPPPTPETDSSRPGSAFDEPPPV